MSRRQRWGTLLPHSAQHAGRQVKQASTRINPQTHVVDYVQHAGTSNQITKHDLQ
jgi:hypothetical protein